MRNSNSGGMGMRKHGRSGHSGHNRDMMQTARELNRQTEESRRIQAAKRGPMVDNVKDLFKGR